MSKCWAVNIPALVLNLLLIKLDVPLSGRYAMNIVRFVACALCAVSAGAQIPFTALDGLPAAQRIGGTSMPSAMGTPILSENGTSPLWLYAFRAPDRLIAVQVLQQAPNDYSASELTQPIDTTDLPIYINASPLPDSILDSDSALRIFSANPTFQTWHAQHRVGTQVLLAGHVRDGVQLPFPPYTPVWIYRAVDSANTSALNCYCTSDGTAYGCGTEIIQRGTYPFAARDGLEFAKSTAGTTLEPCLIGPEDSGVDTNGVATAWVYVFPVDTGNVAVLVQGLDQGYNGTTFPLGDTTGNLGLYFRAAPFANGWVNSTEAMERFRQQPAFDFIRWFIRRNNIERVLLFGGRANPNLSSMISTPTGTAIWLMVSESYTPDSLYADRVTCWCNLEPTSTPFVDCRLITLSVPPTAESVPLTLAPNPAQDAVTVHTADSYPIEAVTLYDMCGRVQPISVLANGTVAWLDLQQLSSGTYIVEVRSAHRSLRKMLQVLR